MLFLHELYKIDRKSIDDPRNQGLPLLNLDGLINDPDMAKWNVLAFEEELDDAMWQQCAADLDDILKFMGKNPEEMTEIIHTFFRETLKTSDAKTTLNGVARMAKRVANIIMFLKKLDLTQAEDLKIAQELIDIMDSAGGACPDRAIVGLEKAELFVKMRQQDGAYILNVIANMFKLIMLESYETGLINPNQAENIETYLYYTLKFNDILNLGVSTNTMLYEDCAQKKPLEIALTLLYEKIVADRFIGFAASQSAFRELVLKKGEDLDATKYKYSSQLADVSDEVRKANDKKILNEIKVFC